MPLETSRFCFSFVRTVPSRNIVSITVNILLSCLNRNALVEKPLFILSFLSPTGSKFLILTFSAELIFFPLEIVDKISMWPILSYWSIKTIIFFHQIGNFPGALGTVNLRIYFEKSNILQNIIIQEKQIHQK